MTKYFGTDGIRGKANVDLDAERAFKVGRYLGYYYSKEGKNKIVIGKDTRLSSDMLENALAAGIAAQGCDAYLVGYCSTPAVCYLTVKEDFICGAMISASHNPYYDNGIKIFSKEGIKLPSEIEDLIEGYIDGECELTYASDDKVGKVVNYTEGLDHYIEWVVKEFPSDLSNLKIAMDCANGSASYTAKRAFNLLHNEPTIFNDEPNGVNINTDCGSTHPEKFQEFMKNHDYDIGLTFDGDADRQILVSSDGKLVDGDFMLYILGKHYRDKGILTNNTVVSTVMANLGLFKALEKEGITVKQTQVGDKYVYEMMCQEDYIVGGEQSGHIILKRHETTGDGLVTALALIEVMIETGKNLMELKEGLRIYPQLLVNVKVTDKNAVLEDAEVQAAIDQVNKNLDGNGRLLVRPSGTEPLLRVMAEAETDEICEKEVNTVADIIRKKYGAE